MTICIWSSKNAKSEQTNICVVAAYLDFMREPDLFKLQ